MKKSFILIAAIASTALAVTAVPALGGKTVKIDSRVTVAAGCGDLRSGGRCFAIRWHGRVKSSKHACEAHRKVKVLKRRQGTSTLVGKDGTNRRGKWRVVQRPPRPGFYYAKALRREVRTAGTTFVCRADRTPVFDLH